MFRTASYLFVLSAAAVGAPIYWQSADLGGSDRGPFSAAGLQEFADQFTLAERHRIVSVRWQGSYFSSDLPPGAASAAFVIRFYADAAGVPAAAPFASFRVKASVTDKGDRAQNRVIYDFSAPVYGLSAGPGVTWISILAAGDSRTRSRSAAVGSAWIWARGESSESDFAASLQADGLWTPATDRRNVVFGFEGTAVPEPGTWALAGAALAAAMAWKRSTVRTRPGPPNISNTYSG